ncbi:cell division protein FtsZ [Urechidicola vernalis]|uniref:Cell division protein FtsZ n=1 Tax=Urechidicola vernalis TaxID=3075600 RepID=A0ABU2Y3X3_9FLAO|nr:cell division protein FtsZ [Urechidicola sp. P050]MDT0552903.1 cell division protein FtsZ [Urechidicola sp. P050]
MDNFENISFDMPKNQSNVIKVIGVGGGGSNAVNHMLTQGINGVDFVICNTDAQALENSQVPTKIQLGQSLTEGLGAGANPEVGQKSALESEEQLKKMLGSNTKMVFINAGMGGGTGTGAAPVIAKFAKEQDLLTIGIVTIPFEFEGKTRIAQARKGVEEMQKHVDSLVVINNNKLREVYGNLGFKAGFSKADEVLATASRGIAEVITHHYTQNIDLRDAKTVLENSGTAIMGSAKASGTNRAEEAISKALDSPLLNDNKIEGAKNVLLLIVSGSDEITIDEIGEINDFIQSEAKTSVNIIMGVGEDEALGDAISVTVIATGFHKDQQNEITNTEPKIVKHILGDDQVATYDFSEKKEIVSIADETRVVHTLEEETTSERIVHTLDSVDEPMELISTTELIKNMNVVYDEISYEKIDDFVITSAVKDIDVEYEQVKANEEQFEFTFELNVDNEETKKEEVAINDIEVIGHEEVKPTKVVEEIKVFELGEYDEFATKMEAAKKPVAVQEVEEVEEELNINVRTEAPKDKVEIAEPKKEVSPLHLTISELQKRSEERKEKMKQFNYKFTNNVKQNIEEIEKEPAYKRMGVELNNSTSSSESVQSKTTLSVDDNDDLQFRSNNSFLHDNVD